MFGSLSHSKLLVLNHSSKLILKALIVFQIFVLSLQLEIMANSELIEVTTGNSQFANKFYSIIAEEEKGKNVFFSPVSAHTVLSMVYQGAAGETADSFASTLNVGNQKIAATGYHDVIKALNSVEDVMLHIANKIYVMKDFPLKENFRKAAAELFLSEAEQVNFADNDATAKKINGWVEEKTQSKIKDLIPADCLDSLTRLVLVNAIYFKGNWAHQFNKNATIKEKFYVSNNETVDCDMMHITKRFNYREDSDLDAKLLEMKYTNHNVSMVIILPNQRDGIEDLEKKLVGVDLSNITHGMRSMEVEVSLPKFKIETTMDLESVLTKMGLGVIFDQDKANFSEISDNDEQLYVSKAIQKAFIEVNEEGAEAAAATEYSWREYDNYHIPQDAFVAGQDVSGNRLYFGQTLYEDKIIPGKITEKNKAMVFEYYSKEYTAVSSVKILCAQNPHTFQWESTNANDILYIKNKILIKGGDEPNYSTYLGRTSINGLTNIGKIICLAKECYGLYITNNGATELIHNEFEILTYSDKIRDNSFLSNKFGSLNQCQPITISIFQQC